MIAECTDGAPAPGRWPPALLGTAVFGLALVIYRAASGFGFVNLDEPVYLTSKNVVQGGLSWAGVRWAFGSMHGSN